MGKDLADAFPEARQVFEEVDEALGFKLSTLCFEGPADDLTATLNAQPALLTHGAAVWTIARKALGDLCLHLRQRVTDGLGGAAATINRCRRSLVLR